MKRTILIFGTLTVLLLTLFQLRHWSLFILTEHNDLPWLLTGVLFIAFGAIASRFLFVKYDAHRKLQRSSRLSKQELRVLRFMADGLSNKEIAEQLFIAESTVKSHVSNILFKLEARRRTEAIKIGHEFGLL